MDQQLSSMILLLEDKDPVVRDRILRRLLNRGESILPDIARICHEEVSPERRRRLQRHYPRICRELTLESLDRLARRQDDASLMEGVYLVTRLLHPELSFDQFHREVMELGREFVLEINEQRTGFENVNLFNHVFYTRLGFHLKDPRMQQLEYASLRRALQDRGCNPAVMVVLYFMFARLCDLNLLPLSMSGGLMPAYVEKDQVLFYVNLASQDATLMSEEELRRFCRMWNIDPDKETYGLVAESEIIVLYLEMLHNLYKSRAPQAAEVYWIARALELFPGEEWFTQE